MKQQFSDAVAVSMPSVCERKPTWFAFKPLYPYWAGPLSEEMLDFGFQYLEKSADIFLNMASIFDSIGNQKIAFIRHRICSMWVL